MKKFRLVQAGGAVLFLAVWAAKYVTHPHHFHLNMLLAAFAFLAGTELGVQVGKALRDEIKDS